MKRLIICILLVIFTTILAYADGWVFTNTSATSDCQVGTYEMAYNGDHSSGADYTCYNSGAANEQGTAQNVTVTSDYVSFTTSNDFLKWTVTGDIAANMDEQGSIFFSVYTVNDGAYATSPILEFYYDSNDTMYFVVDGASTRFRFNNYGGAVSSSVFSTGKSIATWYRCGYSWDTTANTHCARCVTSGTVDLSSPDDEDSEAVDPFAGDPTTFAIGEDLSGVGPNNETRVKDTAIVSGYKATDPGPGL